MSQRFALRFEALEKRELLSATHGAKAHAAATPAPALVLNGTLTVDNHGALSNENMDGGMTNSVPVAGQLAGLGEVRGVWYESSDEYGNYLGPDTITLHDSQGSFTVSFNNASSGPARGNGHGNIDYQHKQIAGGGTGAYARAKETGTLDINMNHAQTTVVSITLSTKTS